METVELQIERALLVGVSFDSRKKLASKESLDELKELVQSAGADPVLSIHQDRTEVDRAFLIGKGKLEELKALVSEFGVDVVVFDEELSPSQSRNLEGELEVKVIDRSELILDIFAQRARSREGKLQVEVAQMEYLLPRLAGKGLALSRLGGGIGTRGPGETKLETDRRVVRNRISRLKTELEKLEQQRELHRQKRRSSALPTVSLIGYTNAGKSTLFGRLCGEATFVSSRMFATLDPLVRKLVLPSGHEALVSDTVGFIRKLPHSLVAAFHATLEEAVEADLLLHVIDASHPRHEQLRQAVYEVLDEIGTGEVPILEVNNKIDQMDDLPLPSSGIESVSVSALTGAGLDSLLQRIDDLVSSKFRLRQYLIPYSRAEVVSVLRTRGRVESVEYQGEGILVTAHLDAAESGRYREFEL